MTDTPRRRRLARPYALTGGRTHPSDASLAIEALVEMTAKGHGALGILQFESREILELAVDMQSVAELAARLEVPIGVARVLVSDLADEGLVTIHPPPETNADGSPDTVLLERVLDGLKAL